MNTKIVVIAIVALLIGVGGGYWIANDSTSSKPQTVMDHSIHGQMNSMMSNLSGKTGDEFDRAFLAEMIVHHEGAVVMAEAALKDAKHQEIKDMANAIIAAQTTEITQMKEWQKSWYGAEEN